MAGLEDITSGVQNFFYPQQTGPQPLSMAAMEARRKMALTLMAVNARKGYPKNLGEGLTAIGDALGERGMMNQLAALENAKAARDAELMKGVGVGQKTPEASDTSATEPATDESLGIPKKESSIEPDTPTQTADAAPSPSPSPIGASAYGPSPTDVASASYGTSVMPPIAPAAPRNAIATAMLQPTTAPGVPQANPTQPGAGLPSPPVAAPSAISPVGLGSPPEAASGIVKAPPPGPQYAQAPPAGLTDTPIPNVRAPTTEPLPPRTPAPTDRMLRIMRALPAIDDPAERDTLIRQYQADKQDQDQIYQQRMEIFKKRHDEWAGAPQAQQEMIKAAEEAGVAKRTAGLGMGPAIAQLEKSSEINKTVPAAASALRNARSDLESGIMAGSFATQKLAYAKFKELVGAMLHIDASDPRIANTESFRSAIIPLVAQMRSSVSGNANISDADVTLALRAAGGDITLDEKTFPRILDALERINYGQAVGHQQRIIGAAAGNATAYRNLSTSFGLPMEQIIPKRFIDRLKEYPESAAEFDAKFKTPGLAARILSGE